MAEKLLFFSVKKVKLVQIQWIDGTPVLCDIMLEPNGVTRKCYSDNLSIHGRQKNNGKKFCTMNKL